MVFVLCFFGFPSGHFAVILGLDYLIHISVRCIWFIILDYIRFGKVLKPRYKILSHKFTYQTDQKINIWR